MRVIQGSDGAGFALESLAESRGRFLDGDDPIEAGVSRFVHLTHSARADGRQYFVRTQSRAGG